MKTVRVLLILTGLTMALAHVEGTYATSGAVYTVAPSGGCHNNGPINNVNCNQYTSKNLVYLRGQGLPSGTYQTYVTDPSGAVLLGGQHTVVVGGTGVFGPIALAPFNDTPNNGGEYKAWFCEAGAGMTHSACKTDNFKVDTCGGYSMNGGCTPVNSNGKFAVKVVGASVRLAGNASTHTRHTRLLLSKVTAVHFPGNAAIFRVISLGATPTMYSMQKGRLYSYSYATGRWSGVKSITHSGIYAFKKGS